MEVTIKVTDKHIHHGLRNDCGQCPVALAVKDAIPEAQDISVGDDDIDYVLYGYHRACLLDPEVSRRISDFDRGRDMEPFEFTANF
jgi:hypothetical protein